MSGCDVGVDRLAHLHAMEAENRRLRELLQSRMVELEERDNLIGRLRRGIRDYEQDAVRRGGGDGGGLARLSTQDADADPDHFRRRTGSTSAPWEELVDRPPHRIRIPRPPRPARLGRKASVTTPTTCDSSGDDDRGEDIELDDYSRGSRSRSRSWGDGSRLVERLDPSSSSSSSGSSSVTAEEEEDDECPPRLVEYGKNRQRVRAITSSIDGPPSDEEGGSSEGGGAMGGWERRGAVVRRRNDFDDLDDGVSYRSGPTVRQRTGVRPSSIRRRRHTKSLGERTGIIIGRRRMTRRRGGGGGGSIRIEHDDCESSSSSSLSRTRAATAFAWVASVPNNNVPDERLCQTGGTNGVRRMCDHDVIRAYAEEILRRASNVEEGTMTRQGGREMPSAEGMRRSKRWEEPPSAYRAGYRERRMGDVAIADDEGGDKMTNDENASGSFTSASYFDCASSLCDRRDSSAASPSSSPHGGPVAATCRFGGRRQTVSIPATVAVRVHLEPSFWLGITSFALSAIVAIVFAIVAFVINAPYLPLPRGMAAVS